MGGAETDILLGAGSLKNAWPRVGSSLFLAHPGAAQAAWEQTFSECYQLDGRSLPEAVRNALSGNSTRTSSISTASRIWPCCRRCWIRGTPVVRRVHDHRMYCMRGGKYNYFTRAVCHRPASWRCVFPCLASIGRNPAGLVPFKWVSYQAKKREIELNRKCDCLLVYSEYQKEELTRNGFDPGQNRSAGSRS